MSNGTRWTAPGQDSTELCPMGCGDRIDAYDKAAWAVHNADHAAYYGTDNPDYFWGFDKEDAR